VDREHVWECVTNERRALHSLLRELEADQWEAPSLCDGWRVRDVAAHVIHAPQATPADVAAEMRDRLLRRRPGPSHRRPGDQDVSTILADYDRFAASRHRPIGTTADDMLVDVLVHTQDVALPLGLRHQAPTAAVLAALGRACRVRFIFGTQRLLRGVRLVAADADWSYGAGAVVEAPAAQLLLVCTGRARAATGLAGPGARRVRGV
jgi:uncharacterized protein (TIGR03083 family)